MKKHSKSLTIFFLFSVLTCKYAAAQDEYFKKTEKTKQIAEAYMEKYTALRFDEVANFYTDNTKFIDHTYNEAYGTQMPWTGPTQIVAKLKEGFSGVSNANFKMEKSFMSGSYFMYQIQLSFDFRASHFDIPLTTILKVVDEKIAEHIDYGDYYRMSIQAAEQAKK